VLYRRPTVENPPNERVGEVKRPKGLGSKVEMFGAGWSGLISQARAGGEGRGKGGRGGAGVKKEARGSRSPVVAASAIGAEAVHCN
jgi:hypothetical protein